MDTLIIGAGIFGLTAALELSRRGHDVRVLDPGPLPHPEASSTDVSKAVRLDYGDDLFFTEMAEACLPLWREWNQRFGETVFREDGFVFVTRESFVEGSFEHASFATLTRRGWQLERLDRDRLRARFPAFRRDRYADGYFNPHDGWVASGRVVELLVAEAQGAGIALLGGQACTRVVMERGRVVGVETDDGGSHRAEIVIVAAGAWTPTLLPWLDGLLRAVGQPVLHFRVGDAATWQPPCFTTWASDIATTGWYGFPALPDGTVKVANHGPGRPFVVGVPRVVSPDDEATCRGFLAESLPGLADAPLVGDRVCLYCDTWDGAFWIDHDPAHPGLVVAAGGSGHGFKFAPMLGDLIADVVERRPNPRAERFAWRVRGEPRVEAARRR